MGYLSKMLFKKSVLGLQNPMKSAVEKYVSLRCASTELIQVMKGEGEFSNANRLLALREERRDEKNSRMTPMILNPRD